MKNSERQQLFADWTREHNAIVFRAVNGFASGDDRDDLLQEVLLAIWKAIPAYRAQAKLTTFLYRVCHNAALTWTRTRKNYRRRIAEYSECFAQKTATGADLENEERLTRLYAAIRQLKSGERSLILLALDGLSYRDMAEVLGISESNVGVRLNRIKNQLTQTLKGSDHERA